MAETTGIQWADSTLNLWIGCTRLSAACDFCYAAVWGHRFGIVWDAPPVRTADSAWAKIAGFQRTAKRFAAEHGRQRRVFINSLSDFFDNQAEQAWRDTACRGFEAAPDVVFMLVTKRPQLIRRMVPVHWLRDGGWPANVWVLTTTENQTEYDRRVIALLDVPAAVRGVSMEPMLSPIDPWAHRYWSAADIERHMAVRLGVKKMPAHTRTLEWSIVGGESGKQARPMPMASLSLLSSQLRNHRTAMFMKQLSQADFPQTYSDFDTFPSHLKIREFPKHV